MSDIVNVLVNESPKIKESIKGEDAYRHFERIGDRLFQYVFFDLDYSGINATTGESGKKHSLLSRLTGRLLTWADSAFEPDRAKAVKDVLSEIIKDSFTKERKSYQADVTEFLKV